MEPPIVILVGTTHPGNVGAIARGASNFGVKELRFVSPQVDILCHEAVGRAKHAAHLLQNAKIYDNLSDALVGVSLSVGTTARTTSSESRHLRKTLDVRDWSESIGELDGQLAIVFGREDRGLEASEVNILDQLVTVPTEDYSSLNLAHAVTLLCYEHLRVRMDERITTQRSLHPDTLRTLHKAWDDLVEQVDRKPWRQDVAKGIFRKILGRSIPADHEIHNIMGIFANTLKRFNHPDYSTVRSRRTVEKYGLLASPMDEEE